MAGMHMQAVLESVDCFANSLLFMLLGYRFLLLWWLQQGIVGLGNGFLLAIVVALAALHTPAASCVANVGWVWGILPHTSSVAVAFHVVTPCLSSTSSTMPAEGKYHTKI
jgi:xanthosine utilization system XapX-like protein